MTIEVKGEALNLVKDVLFWGVKRLPAFADAMDCDCAALLRRLAALLRRLAALREAFDSATDRAP